MEDRPTRLIDLSHVITEGMVTYKGLPGPHICDFISREQSAANYDDVSTVSGGQNILKSALDAFDRVDILVNNAGILRDKSFAKLSKEELEAVLDVHLKGAFYVTQPAFRGSVASEWGTYDAIGTATMVRDQAPDGGGAAAFPGP